MKNYLYVLVNNELEVWDNLTSAVEHYLTIYYYYPHDLHNPKYMSIANQLLANKQIVNIEEGFYNTILDHTNLTKKRDVGVFIRFFDKEYNQEEIIALWEKNFLIIKNIGSEFNVNFRDLMPFQNFKKQDFEKFYKRIFESFDLKIDSIKVTKIKELGYTYSAVINDDVILKFCSGDTYESVYENIGILKEKYKKIEKDLSEEEYEK